ncbi:T9SS-dependent M36 family metallopeptidase [Chryseobacterium sp.]|uniref:T9SS-dependent M36 family metallopeptidase n=1 Tax=Chryseobacterium sp. TaxID=1871047 RepID=UPI0012AA1ED5|nr:T9SS-dependent M36 family metallopeptidase [Chryseobacterium sp.]QFG53522.1 T9SS type A sorting domain-containing protein [Chryseobacterium sp.]
MRKLILSASLLLTFGFLQAQDHRRIMEDFLRKDPSARHMGKIPDFVIQQEDYSGSMKATVLKLQQTVNDIPVFNGLATALVKEGKVHYFSDQMIKSAGLPVRSAKTILPEAALQAAFKQLNIQDPEKYTLAGFSDPTSGKVAKQRTVYFNKDGNLVLGYEFHFHEAGSSRYWDIIADAETGKILHKQNLTLSCTFNHTERWTDHPASLSGAYGDNASRFSVAAPDNASYNVFALPVESPNFGSRSVVSNPWFTDASPEGWHSDGATHYTTTRGNNIYAYDDVAGNNNPGFSPDGGPARLFDFPLQTGLPAQNSLAAAITNLFYTGNKTHDIFYRLGFNENARNFQTNNFGKGGLGNDAVLAEAQDSSDLNNSNFSTPPEGTNPRMQMFLWTPSFVQRLFYNSPASAVPRQPNSRTAEFGPQLTPAGITANIVLSPVIDACTPVAPASMAGKIGLAERGGCNFTVKVKNMQEAGAGGAIIYNNPGATNFGNMGGTDASISIPSVLIENSEGEFIKTTLTAGTAVNVTLKHDPTQDQYADAAFDNGIIIHEYAHGITNRLTGNGYSCLNKEVSGEQMGEGWSDFFALMLTNQPNATASVPRSVATYAAGQTNAGVGIRPRFYSPDFGTNDYTYARTNGMEFLEDGVMTPDIHSIGFVWATILWDLHWKYAEKYGYASDVMINSDNGSTRVLQTVMDGIKLQECNPTFPSGRDAVIAADIAATGGANRCMIWETFAKRGVGLYASAGSRKSINDQTEDFTVPDECKAGNTAATEFNLYPNPADDRYYIDFPLTMFGKVSIEIYDSSGRLVRAEQKLVVNVKQVFSSRHLLNGVYFVKIKGSGGEKVLKLIVSKK